MGMRTGGNHRATSRSSGMKTMASPMPTATRASDAHPRTISAKAKANCATVIVVTPASSSRLGAEPVEQRADRDLHRGVDEQLHHREDGELGGRDVEAVGGEQPGDPEGAAVEDGEDVDGDSRGIDRPRPPPTKGGGAAAGLSPVNHPATRKLSRRSAHHVESPLVSPG